MGRFFASALPTESLLHVATFLISFLLITLLFAAIYKMHPDVTVASPL